MNRRRAREHDASIGEHSTSTRPSKKLQIKKTVLKEVWDADLQQVSGGGKTSGGDTCEGQAGYCMRSLAGGGET